jgi:phage terminase large subunit-like protein
MILDTMKNGGEAFEHLSFPALATHDDEYRKEGEALHPARYDEKYYTALRSSIPPRIWSALYQCNPVPEDGVFFDRPSLENALYSLKDAPDFSKMRIYIPCDAALSTKQTADFTCAWPFGVDQKNEIWFLPFYLHKRGVSSLDLVEWLLDKAKEYKAQSVVLERGHISLAIGPLYKKRAMERGIYARLDDSLIPKADKMVRAQAIEGRTRQGKVHYPDMPWVREIVIPQALAFPAAKHDDIVDTIALAGLLVDKVIPASPPREEVKEDEPAYLSMDWVKRRVVKPVKKGIASLF